MWPAAGCCYCLLPPSANQPPPRAGEGAPGGLHAAWRGGLPAAGTGVCHAMAGPCVWLRRQQLGQQLEPHCTRPEQRRSTTRAMGQPGHRWHQNRWNGAGPRHGSVRSLPSCTTDGTHWDHWVPQRSSSDVEIKLGDTACGWTRPKQGPGAGTGIAVIPCTEASVVLLGATGGTCTVWASLEAGPPPSLSHQSQQGGCSHHEVTHLGTKQL